MSIVVENVSKLYGQQKALDQVSFEVASGQVVGFLGPNGAGKSTMMKIITCFIPQSQGQVLVEGLDVRRDSLEVRKRIGYLPEHNPLYLEMYVKEYLAFVDSLYGLPAKTRPRRVAHMVERTGLAREQHKRVGQLSKGYRQRVGLASAMIHDPKVLILDEPTTGLDPNQILEIRALIAELGQEKTILLSTHIMQEVEAICQRTIIINQGRIVASEQTSDLRHGQDHDRQTVLVEFAQTIDAQLWEQSGLGAKALPLEGGQWLVEAFSKEDIRPKIFQMAIDKGLTVLAMQKKEKSVEQVFRELTRP